MEIPPLHVALDVGCRRHRAAIGSAQGHVLAEFDVEHSAAGFADFFRRIEAQRHAQQPVWVAMEGCNGYARPLDAQVRQHGYRLLNVNNLKLARFKELFPGPAKTDALDTQRMLELLRVHAQVPLAKGIVHDVGDVPAANTQLQRLMRRRRQLVAEKVRIGNRMQADLHAVSPGLLPITPQCRQSVVLRFAQLPRRLATDCPATAAHPAPAPPGGRQARGHHRAMAAPRPFCRRRAVGGADDRRRCPPPAHPA